MLSTVPNVTGVIRIADGSGITYGWSAVRSETGVLLFPLVRRCGRHSNSRTLAHVWSVVRMGHSLAGASIAS